MLTQQEQQQFQQLIVKKQMWLKKSIDEINKGNYELAVTLINFDSGCNIDLQKIIEKYIVPEPIEPNITEASTYEDINIEDESEAI